MSNFEIELLAEQGCNCVDEGQDADQHRHKGHAGKYARQDADETGEQEEQPHAPTRNRFRKRHFILSLKMNIVPTGLPA